MTIDSSARCESDIDTSVDVGPFSWVGSGVGLGQGTVVGSHVTIGHEVVVGDEARIGDGARIGRGATLSERVRVGRNAVVDEGVHLGLRCEVSAGTHVTSTVPPKALVSGTPARIVGYVDSPARGTAPTDDELADGPVSIAAGCVLWPLPRFSDLRGSLVAVEYEQDLPFRPERSFFVFDVPNEEVRGEHAHRWCSQLLVAVHGGLSVVVDDGNVSSEVRLDRPDRGLLIPPLVWGVQYRFTRDAVLGVFASHAYDPADYIRDYEEFVGFVPGGS